MKKEIVNRILKYIREEMTANAPGTQGGFSQSAPAKGPRAGFDPVLGKKRKKRICVWSRSLRKDNAS